MLANEIAPADLEAVDAELLGELVHGALDGKAGLRPAAAAIGRHLNGWSVDGFELDPDVGNAIGPRDRCRGDLRDRYPVRDIRAGVVQEAVPESDHLTRFQRGQLDIVNLRALLRRADEVLATVLDVFHRPVQPHGGHRDQELVRIEEQHLLAEAAAHVGRDDAHLVFVEVENRGEPAAHRDRRLGPVPYRELSGDRIPARRHRPAFHRRRRRAVYLDPNPGDVLGLRKGLIRMAGNLHEVSGDVVRHIGMNERSAVEHGLLEVDLDREGLIVDLDQRGGVLGRVAVDRDHHRDGLADVMDVAARERPLRARLFHRRMRDEQRHLDVEIADVLAGVHGDDARVLLGGARIDRANSRACKGAARKGGMQRMGQGNIVDERAFAAQELGIDIAFDARAEHPGRHVMSPIRPGRAARLRGERRR